MNAEISYGKAQVSLYRTYAAPVKGVTVIPESSFTAKENILFALEVDVEVLGDNFMPAYTHGDNSNVVATDTMKNFVLKQALNFTGSTPESFLLTLGTQFLETYPQMQRLQLTAKEEPFHSASVPDAGGAFRASDVLFNRGCGPQGVSMLEVERDDGARITGHRCGSVGLKLVKITGSSFAHFARDEHTTLPERVDRPLFIYLDVYWRYKDAGHMVGPDLSNYVAAEQVRDLVGVVFHEFVSMSIQHLVHEMGTRLLDRFPQLAEVSFEAQNRLWDTAFTSEEDPRLKVYTDPRPPYGMIKLTLGSR